MYNYKYNPLNNCYLLKIIFVYKLIDLWIGGCIDWLPKVDYRLIS